MLLDELTRGEVASAAGKSLLIIPLGATEQHGPHLPIGTDSMHVMHVAREAATRLSGRVPILLAPLFAVGCSEHHVEFGGTLSLSTIDYYRVLMGVGRSAVASGFRIIFFLNGHGGNHEIAELTARDLAIESPVTVGAGSWWSMSHDAMMSVPAWSARPIPGHSGAFETSVIMSLRPELVRTQPPMREVTRDTTPVSRHYRSERHGSWRRSDGFSDNPLDGRSALGVALLEAAVNAVATSLEQFYTEATQSDP